MKRAILATGAVFLLLIFVCGSFATDSDKIGVKVGDHLYVCGCGKGCDCDTLAQKPGKCTCGKPLVKGTVTRVEDEKALIKTNKQERWFKTVGLYSCACGKGCNCNTISQQPGKCVCGVTMKKGGGSTPTFQGGSMSSGKIQ